jgi:hypothetical protein
MDPRTFSLRALRRLLAGGPYMRVPAWQVKLQQHMACVSHCHVHNGS